MITNSVVENWLGGMPPVTAAATRGLYPLMVALLSSTKSKNEGPIRDIGNGLLSEYDYIVVGGGSGGAVVASRLSEDPDVNVLLLEAGMSDADSPLTDIPLMAPFLQRSDIDWQYSSEPQPGACLSMVNQRCLWPRGKILGGSSVLNYMIYVRGNKRDFDHWRDLGNEGWGYDDVLPYFIKSEDNRNKFKSKNTKYHGTGGLLTVNDPPHKSPLTLSFMASAKEMGYNITDINADSQTGFMPLQTNSRKGRRCSSSKAFLQPARNRPNLHFSVHSMVDKVIMNNNNNRVVGIEFTKNGENQVVRAKREIILSAGSVGTPAILMRSGIGPAEHLRELNIPLVKNLAVGKNLQDHVGVLAMPFITPKGRGFHPREDQDTFSRFVNNGRGPMTTAGGVEALAFLNTKHADPAGDFPDIQFHFVPGGVASDNGRAIYKILGFPDELWESYFKPLEGKDMWSVFAVILRPDSVGEIKLNSKNADDAPKIIPNYLTHPKDVATLVDAFRLMFQMSNTTAFQKVGSRPYETPLPGCESHQIFSEAYFECFLRHATQTIYHPVGTSKMGPSTDPTAVVDPQLRVHGIENLRVVDGSVMPKIVSGNTHAAIVMIGEKASDMIKAARR